MSFYRSCASLVVAGGLLLLPVAADAAVVWVGDVETGDLSQFNFILNQTINEVDYATVTTDEVARGTYAARIELHNDAEWPNGLKRVELQHRPDDARTAEGATTFFAWSVFLPEALPVDPTQQIGYWESTNSFQQMMAFQVAGDELTFVTRQPQNTVQWQDSVLTAGEWHRIAMSVLWSTNPDIGAVSVWFDGEQVVTDGPARTLADNNPHFVQFGLLRGAFEFDDVPVILIDHALEGDSLEDVEYDALPSEGGDTDTDTGGESTGGTSAGSTGSGSADSTGGGPPGTTTSSTTGGSSTSSSGTTAGASGTSVGTTGPGATDTDATATDSAGGDDDDNGCGCKAGPSGGGTMLAWIGVLGLLRRRRA